MVDSMRTALEPWLHEQRGDDVAVAALRRIATGNSRANWYLEMGDGDRYVVRVEQGGVFGTSSAEEFRFMQAARMLGCPVAPTCWLESTGAVIGQPFFVMEFVDGAATGRDDRSMSAELATDFVARLHELHHTDWTSQIESHLTPETATHAAVQRWYDVYRAETDVAIPLLEEGAAWLHHHAPHLDRVGIVHGDPGPGNFVHDGTRVLAFTDWEFTHLGDPMEDWAYLINMRGAKTMPRDAWLALFERIAGVTVTERDLRYWSAFNFFKGACANLTCRRVFATNNPAPNMGLIGVALHQHYVRQLASVTEEV
jgi:aminoglycoside phosphotransferase (APT) family kinase protein